MVRFLSSLNFDFLVFARIGFYLIIEQYKEYNWILFWSLTTHFTLNWLFYRRKFKEVGKNYTRQCQIWSSFDCKEIYHFRKIPYSWSYVWQTCENIMVLEFNVVHHGFKYKLHEVNKHCSSKHYNISKKKWFNYWFFLIFAILWISLSYCFIIFANKRIV